MSKPPAFQFYAKDFMDATRFWDANACGLYIRCICIQWEHGGIPSDLKTLARGVGMDLAEVEALWPTVGVKFEDDGSGVLKNRKLEAVRDRQKEVSEKRRNAANARWEDDANASANGHAKTMQRKEKEKQKVEVEDIGEGAEKVKVELYPTFDDFWDAYGKKIDRPKCERLWARIPQRDREAIMQHVPAYVEATPEVKYRRNPLTYLNGKNWNDDALTRQNTGSAAKPGTPEFAREQARKLAAMYADEDGSPYPG